MWLLWLHYSREWASTAMPLFWPSHSCRRQCTLLSILKQTPPGTLSVVHCWALTSISSRPSKLMTCGRSTWRTLLFLMRTIVKKAAHPIVCSRKAAHITMVNVTGLFQTLATATAGCVKWTINNFCGRNSFVWNLIKGQSSVLKYSCIALPALHIWNGLRNSLYAF